MVEISHVTNVFKNQPSGGNEVRVWDAATRKLLSKLSQHHKTVTCLSLASENRRLVSGSLDKHLKIYDIDTYSVVHSMDYLSPMLSVAVAVSIVKTCWVLDDE